MIVLDEQSTKIAIIVGIVVSMFWYEKKNLSPGGVIVPGVTALFLLTDPFIVVITLMIAFITAFVVRNMSNYIILFGRRRFSMVILVSFGIIWAVDRLTYSIMPPTEIHVLGYIIPGLVANEMERQGSLKTLYSLFAITMLTLLLLLPVIGWSW
jgi:poly-gamma-glutamate biosynthesis protein PgsC/CapC